MVVVVFHHHSLALGCYSIDLICKPANTPPPHQKKKKFFDRQRLFTTIFNPTRLANGEGSTLGTLIFDIELVTLKHQWNKLAFLKRKSLSTLYLRFSVCKLQVRIQESPCIILHCQDPFVFDCPASSFIPSY